MYIGPILAIAKRGPMSIRQWLVSCKYKHCAIVRGTRFAIARIVPVGSMPVARVPFQGWSCHAGPGERACAAHREIRTPRRGSSGKWSWVCPKAYVRALSHPLQGGIHRCQVSFTTRHRGRRGREWPATGLQEPAGGQERGSGRQIGTRGWVERLRRVVGSLLGLSAFTRQARRAPVLYPRMKLRG